MRKLFLNWVPRLLIVGQNSPLIHSCKNRTSLLHRILQIFTSEDRQSQSWRIDVNIISNCLTTVFDANIEIPKRGLHLFVLNNSFFIASCPGISRTSPQYEERASTRTHRWHTRNLPARWNWRANGLSKWNRAKDFRTRRLERRRPLQRSDWGNFDSRRW